MMSSLKFFPVFCWRLDNDAISAVPESEWYLETVKAMTPAEITGLIADLTMLSEAKLTDDELAEIFYIPGNFVRAKTNAHVRLLIKAALSAIIEARRSGRLPTK